MSRAAVIVVIAWTVPAAAQDAQSARDAFDTAIELMMEDRPREAAAALVEVADTYPGEPVADDALLSAAEIYQDTLASGSRAAALYERLVRDYPDSRLAPAAKERLAALSAHLRGGDEALDELLAIKSAQLDAGEAIRRAEALLSSRPDWSGAGAVALWLGGQYERATRFSDAARAYRLAAEHTADPEVALSAGLAGARLATHRGDFEKAEAILARIDTGGQLDRKRAVHDARAQLRSARRRSKLSVAAVMILLLGVSALAGSLRLAAGSWAAAGRALASPPTEALYLAPVCALLVAASATGFPEIASAVAVICGGGLVVTWLSGAGLRLRRGAVAIAVHVAAAAGAIGSICYIALYRAQLLDIIAQTVQFGPDL